MAAPKGNLFALGAGGGRPPKYDDPAVLEQKIAEYLEYEDQWHKRFRNTD